MDKPREELYCSRAITELTSWKNEKISEEMYSLRFLTI